MNDGGRQLRRCCDNLIISGTAVIGFGFWSIIKMTAWIIYNADEIHEFIRANELSDAANDASEFQILYIMLYITSFAELALRIYIGRSAQADGRGRKKSIAYMAAAGIMVVTYVISLYSSLTSINIDNSFEVVITAVVDLTMLFCFVDMIISAIKVRVLRKRLQGGA